MISPPTPDEQLAALRYCSNRDRWGADEQLGLLNLVDDAARVRAASEVRTGESLALGRPFPMGGSSVATHPVVLRLLAGPADAAIDSIEMTPHDPQLTHIDALGHTFLDGVGYGGHTASDVRRADGLSALSVAALRDGIVARGVLLDIAAVRGAEYLAADEYVTSDDLDAAEHAAGVVVGPGDVVVVHVGRAERVAAHQIVDVPVPRAGLHLNALPWLHDRDVAVFCGDCTERQPADPAPVPLPLHQIGTVAMGLCLIDGVLTSALARQCRAQQRYSFLFCCTVPEVPGATGFPVNPVCVF